MSKIGTNSINTGTSTSIPIYTSTNATNSILIGNKAGASWAKCSPSRIKYVLLGEEIYLDHSGFAIDYANYIALINILGRPYYDEIKKQGINFSEEFEKIIQRKFLEMERDIKIDTVLNDKSR